MIYYYSTNFKKKQALKPASRKETELRRKAMSFSTFSKGFTENMFTSVENQFITKYLPQADGDAVRVYLFGLYLCQCAEDFDAETCAKLLRLTPEKITEIFGFWEECDLVHILSRDPLYVEYLPVNAAIGKPKPVRAEKYASFNRELYKQLQKAGKEFKPYEMMKILEFLENNPMEQQAFLLVSEYCVKKDGEKLSSSHILNKAAKLCREHKFTYEQVERDLADFNAHERDMSQIFSLLGINRKIQESDYELLDKWSARGMSAKTLLAIAKFLKKGTLSTLDALAEELAEKEIFTPQSAEKYLETRAERTALIYRVAKKLGVKVENPRPYAEEYAEKWLERGYDGDSLSLIAALCMKLSYGFSEMDALVDAIYSEGIVDGESVKKYCAEREKQFRVLQSLQTVCGVVKKTLNALDMIAAWKNWNFTDAMILEAAKRSTGASAPLPYINKLLSEWKRAGIFTPEAIVNQPTAPAQDKFRNEAAIAADSRADREHHYAVLRQQAIDRAEAAKKKAEESKEFTEAEAALKKGEIELARAEAFSPESLPAITEKLTAFKKQRAEALARFGLKDEDLLPRYHCAKCSDTGYLPDGRLCDCYS